jgi:hypothetical protein
MLTHMSTRATNSTRARSLVDVRHYASKNYKCLGVRILYFVEPELASADTYANLGWFYLNSTSLKLHGGNFISAWLRENNYYHINLKVAGVHSHFVSRSVRQRLVFPLMFPNP